MILISGDLAIALATFFFLRLVGVRLDTVKTLFSARTIASTIRTSPAAMA